MISKSYIFYILIFKAINFWCRSNHFLAIWNKKDFGYPGTKKIFGYPRMNLLFSYMGTIWFLGYPGIRLRDVTPKFGPPLLERLSYLFFSELSSEKIQTLKTFSMRNKFGFIELNGKKCDHFYTQYFFLFIRD